MCVLGGGVVINGGCGVAFNSCYLKYSVRKKFLSMSNVSIILVRILFIVCLFV